MAEVQKGFGVVWGTGTLTVTGGILSGTTTAAVQTITLTRNSEKTNIKTIGGEVAAQVFHGFMKTASVTVIPSGTTIALAATSSDSWMPKPGTAVTLADSYGTLLDDNWNVISARQGRTVDGAATVDLELEAGDENTELAGSAIAAS